MKKRVGTIRCTVEALHDDESVIFDLIEKDFKVLDVDHSELDYGIVKLLLEDISTHLHFITTDKDKIPEYEMIITTWNKDRILYNTYYKIL
jgi:hypothetical protein